MDRILCLLIYLIVGFSRFSKVLARFGFGSYDEWKKGKKLKILLVGYNGARNTGSDVRVVSIAKQVKELWGKENVQITVMTLDAKTLAGYFDDDVELLTFSSFYPFDLYRACCSHHAAILCEGSTLKSTFANALTLFMAEAAGIMSRQGKPCIAFGAEVGQMDAFLEKAVEKLCHDTYFITRTHGSLAALKKIGLKGHTGTDAAWLYDHAISSEEAERLLRKQGWDGKKPLLGIAVINPFCWPVKASLRKWLRSLVTRNFIGQYDKWYYFSYSPARKKAYDRYIKKIAKGIGSFAGDHPGNKYDNYFPVLIGMERLDEKACRHLKTQLACPCAMFLSGEYSADIMTGILRKLDMLVTSRYHAAVLSMEDGCPIIAISMDERLDGIMSELSMDRKYLMHVKDKDLEGKLHTALSRASIEQEDVHRIMRKQVEKYRLNLTKMGAFMKKYIEDALARL